MLRIAIPSVVISILLEDKMDEMRKMVVDHVRGLYTPPSSIAADSLTAAASSNPSSRADDKYDDIMPYVSTLPSVDARKKDKRLKAAWERH
mmetsp:Transcript_18335/g.40776  ORF Transcript_18335/g.40776 Transcript_18335/m.40776 type:complete len:91 (+) Transcript_18335:1711-1983(+)